jgi:hypothetical protein
MRNLHTINDDLYDLASYFEERHDDVIAEALADAIEAVERALEIQLEREP